MGLVGALGTIRLVEKAIPLLRIDIIFNLRLNWRVIAVSILLAAAAGVGCGLVPARAATRIDFASTIVREGSGGTRRLRARSAFVVAQVALSVILVVCTPNS